MSLPHTQAKGKQIPFLKFSFFQAEFLLSFLQLLNHPSFSLSFPLTPRAEELHRGSQWECVLEVRKFLKIQELGFWVFFFSHHCLKAGYTLFPQDSAVHRRNRTAYHFEAKITITHFLEARLLEETNLKMPDFHQTLHITIAGLLRKRVIPST